MAITESRMTQLTGPYADLNKSNMLVGEMAVPSDHVPVVRNGVNSWEDLLTSQSAGEIIALSETMEQQIADFEQLEIDKVGINDSSATLTQAYSGSKTQGLINEVNTNLGLKASQTSLNATNAEVATKAEQSDLNATNAEVALKADKSEVTNVMTPKGNFPYASLPTTGNTVGWYYYCPDGDGTNGAGNYAWNGTAWYFAGTGDQGYNMLKNDLEKVDDKLYVGVNKVNKYSYTSGYYRAFNTGEILANASYCYTDYTPIKGNTQYKTNLIGAHISFYDNYKKYVGGSNGSELFTTPLTAKYVVASAEIAYINSMYIMLPADANRFVYQSFRYNTLFKNNRSKMVIVDASGDGDYISITKASENEPAGTLIFIKSGVYDNEIVTGCWSKEQYFVGENRDSCIVKNHTGDYNYNVFHIAKGLIKNLTIIAEHTEETPEVTSGEYAVHSETNYLANGKLTIENCYLKSDFDAGLGMGMRGGCHVTLRGCYLESSVHRALYVHDSDLNEYTGLQWLTLEDCVLFANNTNPAFVIQSQEKVDSIYRIEMIRTRLKSKGVNAFSVVNWYGGTSQNPEDFQGGINVRLYETSWGNSESAFNTL